MSARPCPHCGRLHPPGVPFCPVTGKRLSRRRVWPFLSFALLGAIGCSLVLAGAGLLWWPDRAALESVAVAGRSPEAALDPAALDPVGPGAPEPADSPTPLAPSATATATPAASATPTASPTTSPSPTAAGLGGQVVFVSYRDGDEEIYRMNADGTDQTRLTHSPHADNEPALSPDGRWIVFVSQRAGGHKLFIMDADGTHERQLTDGRAQDEYDPYVSPDGEWIVYSSSRGSRFELWLIKPDGSGLRQLTSGPNAKHFPAWSPDGAWIAYSTLKDGVDVVKVIRSDGSGEAVVLMRPETYVSGWVGDRILLVGDNGATTDLFTLGLEGDLRQLTTDPANDRGAYGTPDGAYVLFNSARGGNDDVYVMRPDGSAVTRLTTSSGNDYMAAWGPLP